jgi:hypothetical protein
MNLKTVFLSLLLLPAGLIPASGQSQDVLLSTKNTSLLLRAETGKAVTIAYYGDLIRQGRRRCQQNRHWFRQRCLPYFLKQRLG